MVGSTLLCRVDSRLWQIMGKNESFGGLSVIVVGDLYQLPPVVDSPVYKCPSFDFSGLMTRNPLWDEFEIYELTKIMRQRDELDFINVLKGIALGTTTTNDINLISSRVVQVDEVPENAIRLYSRNADVGEFNLYKIANHPGEEFISIARDSVVGKVNDNTKCQILNSIRTKKITELNGLPHELKLKIGIKYMVTTNIDVEDGLVNGACGILQKIIFKPNTNKPYKVFLDFSSDSVGQKARLLQHYLMVHENIDLHLTHIDKNKHILNISNKLDQQVIREQFLLFFAEAVTIHKSQGQTFKEICINFEKCKRIIRLMLYVALSRVVTYLVYT